MISPRRRPPAAVASYRVWQAALIAASAWAHIATLSLFAQAIAPPAAAAAAEGPPSPATIAIFAASTMLVGTGAAAAAAAPAASQTAVAAAAPSPRWPEEWRDQPARRRRASEDYNRVNFSEKPAAYLSKAAAYFSVPRGGGHGRTPEARGTESTVVELLTAHLPRVDERALRWGSSRTPGGDEAEARAVSVIEAVGKAGRAGERRGEGAGIASDDQHQREGLHCTGSICGRGRHRGAAVSGDRGRLVEGEAGLEAARTGGLELESRGLEVREVNANKVQAEQRFLRAAGARKTEPKALAATATARGAAEREDGADAESRLPPHERSGEVGGARVEDVTPFPTSSKPFPDRHGEGGLRPARRRAADDVESSTHDAHEEGDDEAVDGFGSVGLLAFVVCFGLLFCVMEVAKCYLLLECRRRQQSRRRREEDVGNREGQMPLADSRPVAPSAPPAGSKEDWVEVVVDGVSIGAKLAGDKNATDVPSARGYAVADASHALQEAIEHAERLSPSRGSRVVFTMPPPPRSALPRPSPAAVSPRRGVAVPAPSHGVGEGQGREV